MIETPEPYILISIGMTLTIQVHSYMRNQSFRAFLLTNFSVDEM